MTDLNVAEGGGNVSTTTCPYCQRRQHRDEWDRRPKGMVTTDRTHGPDCWRDPGHHECAVARVEELQSEVRERLEEMNMEASKVFMAREALHRAEQRATTAGRALVAISRAFEPVWDWYGGDDDPDSELSEMVGLAVADLQDDRKQALAAERALAELREAAGAYFERSEYHLGGVRAALETIELADRLRAALAAGGDDD